MLHQNSLNTFNTVDDYLIRFTPVTDFLFCILKIIIATCFRRCSRGFCFVHTVPECFEVFQYVSNMFRICSGLFRVILEVSGLLRWCSGLFEGVPCCSEGVPCCSGGVPGCSVLFRRCSGLFRAVPGYSGVFRSVLEVFRAVPEVFRAVLGCSVRSGGVPGSSGLVFRVLVHAEQISRVLIGWAVVPS